MTTTTDRAQTKRLHLTMERIRKLQPPSGDQAIYTFDDDSRHLCVRVTPAGAKSFVFSSKLHGSRLRMTIGAPEDWTIEAAREEARRLQVVVDRGDDPREIDRAKRAAKEEAKASAKMEEVRKTFTLKKLCLAYVEQLNAQGKIKSARDARSAFNVHVFQAWPDYSELAASDVTSQQIADIVRKVFDSGKTRSAGILRSYLTTAYNMARRAPFDPTLSGSLSAFNIITNPSEILPSIPVNRGERTLNADELKAYIKALGDDMSSLVLKVALYSGGQRIAQLARAKVLDYDRDQSILRLWDKKGKRTAAREHLLPLGPVAAEIVTTLVNARSEETARIFTVAGQAVGMRAAEAAETMGTTFTLRDIRRTCETMLASLKVSKDVRAQLLSHGISGVQAAHYDRYDYIDEKRQALRLWEQRLSEIAG